MASVFSANVWLRLSVPTLIPKVLVQAVYLAIVNTDFRSSLTLFSAHCFSPPSGVPMNNNFYSQLLATGAWTNPSLWSINAYFIFRSLLFTHLGWSQEAEFHLILMEYVKKNIVVAYIFLFFLLFGPNILLLFSFCLLIFTHFQGTQEAKFWYTALY